MQRRRGPGRGEASNLFEQSTYAYVCECVGTRLPESGPSKSGLCINNNLAVDNGSFPEIHLPHHLRCATGYTI